MQNGRCLGAYFFEIGEYWIYDATRCVWTNKATCPVPLPFDARYGVLPKGLSPTPKYIVNGRPATQEDALKAIEQADFSKDKEKFRVTIVANKQDLKKIVNDLDAKLSSMGLKEKVILKGYEPNAWEVKEFKVTDTPSIYCQSPSGEVLHLQTDYEGGASEAVEAISAAIESFDPSAVVDRRKKVVNSDLLTVVAAIAVVVLVIVLGGLSNGPWS